MHMHYPYAEDYTNRVYRAFLGIDPSDDLTCRAFHLSHCTRAAMIICNFTLTLTPDFIYVH